MAAAIRCFGAGDLCTVRFRPTRIVNALKVQILLAGAVVTDIEVHPAGVPTDSHILLHAAEDHSLRGREASASHPTCVYFILKIWTALEEAAVTMVHGPRIEGTEHRRTPCVLYCADEWGQVTKYDLRLLMFLSLGVTLCKAWWMMSDFIVGLEQANQVRD
ncbi:hypothetical protein OF83DRAFT_1176101 [Amylostereum chailletii]|nr:hypothetical protein OF83DRAFT_1176101 [Amylostereum chailletii]